MLLELSIKDFAIIDSVTIGFGQGLNIFTGETGAGKSIIIDALALILGDRASNEIIRGSREEAQIEALFDVEGRDGVGEVLDEAGIARSDNLVVKRVIQRAGRNRIYINGSLATLMTLSEVGRRLIDIYGQSEHQSLTRPDEHVELLDAFGGHGDLRAAMAEAYRSYGALKKELDALREGLKASKERREFLDFQLKEIEVAGLAPGEEESLRKDSERLRHAEKIKSAASGAESVIYSGEGSVVERLGGALKALKEAATHDERLGKTVETIESGLYALEDAAAFLRGYADSIEADPDALEKTGARIDLINKLKKKYGATVEEILAKKGAIEKELSGIETSEERIRELDGLAFAAGEKASLIAKKLTEAREKAATDLKKEVEAELQTLGMKGAVFEVAIEPETNPDGTARLNERGAERVSFYISPNPGEEVKPLAQIASGGELSRIMLAIKRATAAGRVPTLVFDEIDAGIGGATSQAVGGKLKEVAATHQVICVTHLPQIAAFADRHYSVAKKATADGRTVTSITELGEDGSIEEMSRMLGGMNITDTTRKQARELREAAKSLSSKKPGSRRRK